MASAWYPKGLTELCKGGRDIDNGSLKISLINTGTSYSNAHDFWDDVSAGAIGTPIGLSSVTFVSSAAIATLDAADTGLTWNSVAVGSTVVACIIYWDSGTPGTSPLVAWLECTSTPTNGGNITITLNGSGIGTITC